MTEQEKEILIITAEECGEVIQAVTKILRFGKESKVAAAYTNMHRLEEEIGDLYCMIGLLIERGLVSEEAVYKASTNKYDRLKNYSNIFDVCDQGLTNEDYEMIYGWGGQG